MNIGIIGGGSIGLLLSHYMSKYHNITLYVRRVNQKMTIVEKGILLQNKGISRNLNVLMNEQLKKEDLVIVCVKQPDVSNVLPYIRQTNPSTPLLFLQNGMGHVDDISHLQQTVFVGVVEHGAYRQNDFTVSHTGQGVIRISLLHGENDALQTFGAILHSQDFPVKIHQNWYKLLSEKLIINAVINPLTALFDVNNGVILTNPFIKRLAEKLCIEAAHTLELQPHEQWERVQHIAQLTSENVSSMLKDIRAQQPTEIDAISGYLLDKKKAYDKPYTTFVYQSIKALEMRGN